MNFGTPKKLKSTPIHVNNLPGKQKVSSKKKLETATKKKSEVLTKKKSVVVNKKKDGKGRCKVCSIIWNSKDDLEFQEKTGKRQGEWIGCDVKNCSYWAHVKCVVLVLSKKPVASHAFRCEKHKV